MMDNSLVNISFDSVAVEWPKVIQSDGRRSYSELERELGASHELALQLVIRCIHAETERDMLARKVQELTAPLAAVEPISGVELTAALSVMDELRRNRR